ncbi:MAG: type I restriction enzyme HsdR N-terminal domain-containing protein [Desulfobacterales bacterium]|jgi:hypothetical protein
MMSGHHLILGELEDFLTGEVVQDTHDERYRQKIARLLVVSRAYPRSKIISRYPLMVAVGGRRAIVPVDFLVGPAAEPMMIVKYGPGSLTTRHRSALAAAVLIGKRRVPICVVTNGEDAEVLDSHTGTVLASGLEDIPTWSALKRMAAGAISELVSDRRREMAARILYAFEVDGKCPCDDTVCEL